MDKTRRKRLRAVLGFLLCMALGFGAGYIGAALAGDAVSGVLGFVLLVAGAYLGCAAQLVAHEAGHLAAGLATGYRFVSFRVGSLMLIRQGGRLRLRRYSLAGTGGQCLLAPPPWREHGFPAVPYNLGGVAANLLLSALSLAAMRLAHGFSPLAAACFAVTALCGLLFAVLNGLPLRVGGMPNDGLNALCSGRDEGAARALWAQLTIHAAQAEGRRLREMPAAWFELPEGAAPDDPLKAAVEVFRTERLRDAGREEEAEALSKALLADAKLAAVHRYALQMENAFDDLLSGRPERMDAAQAALRDKELRQFARAMRRTPSVCRVEYAAALAAGDAAAAGEAKKRFEKSLAGWPYAGDAAGERERLARATAALGGA